MDEKEATVGLDEARDAVEKIARRLGLLHLCFARAAVDELGEAQGRELIKKAIWAYGTYIGQETRERVIAQGLEPTPENFGRGSDLSPIGFNHGTTTVDGEELLLSFGCAMADVWREHGEEDLGGLYCLVDPAKMQAYDPDWTMVHIWKIPEGDDCCRIAVRPVGDEPTDRGDCANRRCASPGEAPSKPESPRRREGAHD